MLGTIVNALSVLAGGVLGVALRRRIPERMRDIAMQGIGLVTLVIGMQMALGTRDILVVILSVVAGGLDRRGGRDRGGARAPGRAGRKRGSGPRANGARLPARS